MSSSLVFRPLTLADIPTVAPLLPLSGQRTCDYTVGGLFLWADYFKYRYCIIDRTLFIMGLSEGDTSIPAFSLPIGEMPLNASVDLIERYCRENGLKMRFSAIPHDCLDSFCTLRQWDIYELPNWADYIYDIDALASLSGKKLAKKRNHVNRFHADNPDAFIGKLSSATADAVIDAFCSWTADNGSATAAEERQMTLWLLRNLDVFGFEGMTLHAADSSVVAFTLGEVIGDTLYVHIEKMDHRVAGAGETINQLFAQAMRDKYPALLYVNREDDAGDPGLRQAKQSYAPTTLLRKFDLSAEVKDKR